MCFSPFSNSGRHLAAARAEQFDVVDYHDAEAIGVGS